MTPYKGRKLELEQKVKVYRNLRNGKFSVIDTKTGLVVGHTNCITLVNTHFTVNENRRQKVLKEKRKNVHAFVIGTYFPNYKVWTTGKEVYYNPYEQDCFMLKNTNSKIEEAGYVVCQNSKVFVF